MEVRYKSTRSEMEPVSASQAILRGLAEDGGLFVPDRIPKIDKSYTELSRMSYQELAYEIMTPNENGCNNLHSGPDGFEKRIWSAETGTDSVRFTLHSKDGDQGFPGEADFAVTYSFTEDHGASARPRNVRHRSG